MRGAELERMSQLTEEHLPTTLQDWDDTIIFYFMRHRHTKSNDAE